MLGMEAEMLKGHLDAIVLAALESGPAHGYAIIEAIKSRSGSTFDLPEGTIYPGAASARAGGAAVQRLDDAAGRPQAPAGLCADQERHVARLPSGRKAWGRFAKAVDVAAGGRPRMAGVIDGYVAALQRELDFDPALARRMADEVEAHLWDAAEADPAWPSPDAERRAVERFGLAREIAAQFATDAVNRQARRTWIALLATVAVTFVAMRLRVMWLADAGDSLSVLAPLIDRYAFVAAIAVAAIGWLAFRRSRPAARDLPRRTRRVDCRRHRARRPASSRRAAACAAGGGGRDRADRAACRSTWSASAGD